MKAKKLAIITGASRGVGKVMALKLAALDYTVVLFARRQSANNAVAEEIRKIGGAAVPCLVDVGDERKVFDTIQGLMKTLVAIPEEFVLINNASAIFLNSDEKRAEIMKRTIVDGTRSCIQACLPYLREAGTTSHIINVSPPIPMAKHWIDEYGEYALAKRTVSEFTETLSKMFPDIFFNSLWPATMLYTDATSKNLFGEEKARKCSRRPEIMADALGLILEDNASGRFWTDEQALRELGGVIDLTQYLLPGGRSEDLLPDIFV